EHDGKDDVQTNSRIQTAVISAPQRPIAFGFCVRRISLLRADHDPIARARGAAPLVVWSGRMRTIGAICLLRPLRSRRLPAAIPSSMPGMLAALMYLRGSARWHRSTPCAETSITAPGARTYL